MISILLLHFIIITLPYILCRCSTAWKLSQSLDQVPGNQSYTQVPDDTNTIIKRYQNTIIIYFFSGQCVDGPQNGVSPPPWHVQVSYPPKFTDAIQKVRVPHSSFIKVCL